MFTYRHTLQSLIGGMILFIASTNAGAVTLTFDEVPTQPIDGLTIAGVTFGFTVDGVNSNEALYNSGGPGPQTYVDATVAEGPSNGILTMDFENPTTNLQFGVALSTGLPLTPGFSVELFDIGLASLGIIPIDTNPLIQFTEGLFDYSGNSVSRAIVTFATGFDEGGGEGGEGGFERFAIDNLTFDDQEPTNPQPVPEPGSMLLLGTGLLGIGLLGRKKLKGQQ